MSPDEIKAMQSRIGVVPDGFWGPKSIAACKAHLRSMMPHPNPWPKADHVSMLAFYGRPGDETNLATIAFPFPVFYGGKRVTSTRAHKRCAASLLRIMAEVSKLYGGNRKIMEEAEDYGGCYNFRTSRGSSAMSKHAWGAAIDLDDDDNTYRDAWPAKADMPLEIMECFAREGWLSAGAFWGYDAMHHQATQ